MVAGMIAGDMHESSVRCPCRGAVAVTAVRRGGDMGGILAGNGSAAIAAAS